ncbi:MAG: hypothetical protein ACPKQO_06375 [Nitrososphaeraceae archaeon]
MKNNNYIKSTISSICTAIKHFYDMNYVYLRWKKLDKFKKVAKPTKFGSFLYFRIYDFIPIDEYQIYKIREYARKLEEYFTFCTPECRMEMKKYLILEKGMEKKYGSTQLMRTIQFT